MATVYHTRKNKHAQGFSKNELAQREQNRIDAANIAFAADNGLGMINRQGRPVFYSFPVGGDYREAANPRDLVEG